MAQKAAVLVRRMLLLLGGNGVPLAQKSEAEYNNDEDAPVRAVFSSRHANQIIREPSRNTRVAGRLCTFDASRPRLVTDNHCAGPCATREIALTSFRYGMSSQDSTATHSPSRQLE